MSNRRDEDTPIVQTFEQYLADKAKADSDSSSGAEDNDTPSGNYHRDAKRELERFQEWCRGDLADSVNTAPRATWTGIRSEESDEDDASSTPDVRFSDLDATVFGDYARFLTSRGYANSTVLTYYAHVASWCGWAHKQGYLPRHYARESDAEDPLPEDDGRKPGDQQAWSQVQRDRLTRYVAEQVDSTLDEHGEITVPMEERGDLESDAVREKARARLEAVKRCRERALVYILCYTGLRVGEFLSDADDDRPGRNGIRWEDVSLTENNLTVYRKKQQWMQASLPEPVVPTLERYKQVLDPPEDWRVFVTLHRPTLASHIKDGLEAQRYDQDTIDELRAAKPDLLIAADEGLDSPPSIKPNGARRMMKRLCESAGIDVDDSHGYLVPHGGRRGMGEVMVREFGFAAAARYLDNSEQQVREAYQHIEAAERADMATEAIANTDRIPSSDQSDGDPSSNSN